ncbi:hypothetical protein BUALT_Bualt03G0193500 [Buddleja alternifolia]|uniref:protein-tyrosine-phosphatase n=1 Tax=Buddleja alternifolia TaxID=168488 RepID=A0AAV6Y1Y3_9LAMI|nr:hypothetical protein BUALT_Bualt03G0193500 [Buddleja alternifolia]
MLRASMDQKMNVYIWDMDETLILLKSLLNGTYAGAFNGSKNLENGVKIGKLWENHILQVCDKHFFYEQIENFNQPYLDVLNQHDDGLDLSEYDFSQDGFGSPNDVLNKRKLAYRHRTIADKYRKVVSTSVVEGAPWRMAKPLRHGVWRGTLLHDGDGDGMALASKGLYNILSQDLIKLWDSLYDLTDTYTEKWLSSARACLEQCAGQKRDAKFEHVNVLVTSGPLVPSLVKCLFFRLDNIITCDNVYSSLEVGKVQCFLWIKERFVGADVKFCAIGNGWEECEAAECMRWPFVQIDLQPTSIHRFPGLTSHDLTHYFSVVYDQDSEKSSSHHT